jgi:hypothetical protein
LISKLKENGDYLGSHSDKHLLYCDWTNRDTLLVSKKEFTDDLGNSYFELNKLKVSKDEAHYFLPPYEWYNDSIALWTSQMGLQLVNFTPGTRSNQIAMPGMKQLCGQQNHLILFLNTNRSLQPD